MIRSAMLALTAFSLTATGVHLWSEYAPPAGTTSPPALEAANAAPRIAAIPVAALLIADAEMGQRMKTRRDFAAFNDHLLQQLVQGRVGLEQAREHVLQYCLAHYPDFLQHIQTIEEGPNVRQKLAHCLLRLVRDYKNPLRRADDARDELAPEVLTNLEAELEELSSCDSHVPS